MLHLAVALCVSLPLAMAERRGAKRVVGPLEVEPGKPCTHDLQRPAP